jgi:hypothetical protein
VTGKNGVESFAWRYSVFKGLAVVENRCLNVNEYQSITAVDPISAVDPIFIHTTRRQ